MAWVTGDFALNYDAMLNNAKICYPYLRNLGFTREFCLGMLGNFAHESFVNPHINAFNNDGGFGIAQWTPKSKIVNWAEPLGLNFMDGDVQLQRIKFEYENGLQWQDSNSYDPNFPTISWKECAKKTDIDFCTKGVAYCYERPNKNMVHMDRRLDLAHRFEKDISDNSGSIEGVIEWFTSRIGKVTYSQIDRWYGNSADCSSSVYQALYSGKFLKDKPTEGWTGSLASLLPTIATEVTRENVIRGDIFLSSPQLNEGHTGVFTSKEKMIDCHYNGGITGELVATINGTMGPSPTQYFRLNNSDNGGGGNEPPPTPTPVKKELFSIIEIVSLIHNQQREILVDDVHKELMNNISNVLYGKTNGDVEPQLLNSEFTSVQIMDNYGNAYAYQMEFLKQEPKNVILISGSVGESNKVHYTFKEYMRYVTGRHEQLFEHGVMDNSPRSITVLADQSASFMQQNKNRLEAQNTSFNENRDILNRSQALNNNKTDLANRQSSYNADFALQGSAIGAFTDVIGLGVGISTGNPAEIFKQTGNLLNSTRGLSNAMQNKDFTEQGNSLRSQSNTLSNMQAKNSFNQSLRAWNSSIKDTNAQPTSIIQVGSDMSFLAGNELDEVLLAYRTGTPELLQLANIYIKGFGVMQNKYYNDVKEILKKRKKFNYVKCINVEILGMEANESHVNSFKSIFLTGVRIWENTTTLKDDFGNIEVDNLDVK